MNLKAISKRIGELEVRASRPGACMGCQESCPKAESCPVWYFRAVIARLEDERRAGRQLNQLRDALDGMVGIRARGI